VGEFADEIGGRLRTTPVWRRMEDVRVDEAPTPLDSKSSRIALVLHHELWDHDPATQRDAAVLRERLGERADSVVVMLLDDTPLPGWLDGVQHLDLAVDGRTNAVEFVLGALVDAGGSCADAPTKVEKRDTAQHWPDPPRPFLAQPRAFSTLRHEFDVIVEELESAVDDARAAWPERTFELHLQPHRVIARLEDVAISVSWVTGRDATVADGRLMVIAWRDVPAGVRGLAALKSARPTRERIYNVEGTAPDQWRWRSDDRTGQPYSSANLVAQWLARASIARAKATNGQRAPT
jgi:hypothetical protein